MVVSSRPAAVAGGATERGAGRARPGGAARAQAGRPRGLPSRREQIRGQPCVHRQAAFGRCRLSSPARFLPGRRRSVKLLNKRHAPLRPAGSVGRARAKRPSQGLPAGQPLRHRRPLAAGVCVWPCRAPPLSPRGAAAGQPSPALRSLLSPGFSLSCEPVKGGGRGGPQGSFPAEPVQSAAPRLWASSFPLAPSSDRNPGRNCHSSDLRG